MRVRLQGQAETPGQAEICQLDRAQVLCEEDVARLEVPMHDAPLMAVKQAVQNPPHHALDLVNA